MDAPPLNLVRPDVPMELAVLVATMMAKEPERRFQTPREVAQALIPFLKKETPATQPSKPDLSLANATNRPTPIAGGGTGSGASPPGGDVAPAPSALGGETRRSRRRLAVRDGLPSSRSNRKPTCRRRSGALREARRS